MKKKILLILITMLAAISFAMPPHSYLRQKAPTHAALMSQVKNDSIVADRYRRHFGMTQSEVEAYFGGLRLARQPKESKARVFWVPEDGRLSMSVQRIKKDQLIWVDGKNRPILLEKCGNPVTLGPKKATSKNIVLANEIVNESVPREMIDDAALASEATTETVYVATVPKAIYETAAPVVSVPAPAPGPTDTTVVQVARDTNEWLALFPIGFMSSRASASFNIPPPAPRSSSPAVPEPASILGLGLGAAALFTTRIRMARKS